MPDYNSKKHHRHSIRLKGYDYSKEGLYFITICTQNRECFFGHVQNKQMVLNDAGIGIGNEWIALKSRFPNIKLHEYVVMPNHFHGIIEITVRASLVDAPGQPQNGQPQNGQPQNGQPQNGQPQNGQPQNGQPQNGQPQGFAPTIGNMMDAFKSITTVEYIRGVKNHGWKPFRGKFWQRNYWEHIIRDDDSYLRIANYIINNPEKWDDDQLNAKNPIK
jgi:REP element-mobilizing transposase RayT